MVAILPGFGEGAARLRRHQRRVQHLQLGAGATLAHLTVRVLRQARHHARAPQEVQVMGQGHGVTRIMQLP